MQRIKHLDLYVQTDVKKTFFQLSITTIQMLSGRFCTPLWKLLMSFNLFPLVTFNYRCLPQSSRPWRVSQGTVTVALSPWQTVTPATTAKRAELIGLNQCRTSLRMSSVEWEKFPSAFPTLSKSHTGEMCKLWRYLIPVLIERRWQN